MNIDLVSKALDFASVKHAEQKRKYTELPYTTNLTAVVQVLRDYGV